MEEENGDKDRCDKANEESDDFEVERFVVSVVGKLCMQDAFGHDPSGKEHDEETANWQHDVGGDIVEDVENGHVEERK